MTYAMKISGTKQFIMDIVLRENSMEMLIINYNKSELPLRVASFLALSTLINVLLIFNRREWLILFSLPNKAIPHLTGSWKNPANCWKTQ